MSHSAEIRGQQTTGRATPGMAPGRAVRCVLPVQAPGREAITVDLCNALEQAGCPLAPGVRERLRCEDLLAELSATFVNLPAAEVDSQIESALGRLVVFLELDRGGLAQLPPGQNQLVITQSYHVPGVPPHSRMILDEQLPWYAGTIYR